MTPRLRLFLAAACGLVVANLYYAQPIAGVIGAQVAMAPSAVGLLVTFTQIGYGLGLVLVAPLGDMVENRRLIASCLAVSVTALLGMVFAPSAAAVLAASFLIGLTCVAAQIIVPYAAHLATDATRGRTVGDTMSGLMVGIMLARPVSSFITHWFGWRAVFVASACVMAALSLLMLRGLPQWRARAAMSYFGTLKSLAALVRKTPALRRRILYHAPLFAAFSLFWTASPLLLAGPRFGLTQQGIALFALVGAGGAIIAPIAGRAADRGDTRLINGVAIAAVAVGLADGLGGRRGGVCRAACGRRRRARHGRHRQSGAEPAHPVRFGQRGAKPPQRPLHRRLLPRRRGWLRPVEPRLRQGRLAADQRDGARLRARRLRLLPHRAASVPRA